MGEKYRRRVEELAELERQRWKAVEERGESAEHPRLDELEEQRRRARKLK